VRSRFAAPNEQRVWPRRARDRRRFIPASDRAQVRFEIFKPHRCQSLALIHLCASKHAFTYHFVIAVWRAKETEFRM
jgi:hypothetical protein